MLSRLSCLNCSPRSLNKTSRTQCTLSITYKGYQESSFLNKVVFINKFIYNGVCDSDIYSVGGILNQIVPTQPVSYMLSDELQRFLSENKQ